MTLDELIEHYRNKYLKNGKKVNKETCEMLEYFRYVRKEYSNYLLKELESSATYGLKRHN